MNKNMIWGLVVVALVVGVFIGYSVEKQRATDKLEATKMMMQKQIDDTKMAAKDTTMDGRKDEAAMMKKQEDIMMMAQGDASSLKGTLTDVSGGQATGKAFVLRKDGKLDFTVSATLSDPTTGSSYEGWLVKKGSTPVQLVDT